MPSDTKSICEHGFLPFMTKGPVVESCCICGEVRELTAAEVDAVQKAIDSAVSKTLRGMRD